MGCKASKAAATDNTPSGGGGIEQVRSAKSQSQTPVSKNGMSVAASSSTLSSNRGGGGGGSGRGRAPQRSNSNSHEDEGTSSCLQLKQSKSSGDDSIGTMINAGVQANKPERLYKLLAKALQCNNIDQRITLYKQVLVHCQQQPMAAKWENPTTKSTALHIACRLLDIDASNRLLLDVVDQLLAIDRDALRHPDAAGHIPLHYAIAPTTHFQNTATNNKNSSNGGVDWKSRSVFLQHILQADSHGAYQYLAQTDVVFESGDATGSCSPMYRVLQTLPDDFSPHCPTAEYVHVLTTYAGGQPTLIGNTSDGDLPLALLYRRFTRQFDISEKFFAGDNSRPEVLQHRKDYKLAAGTTWKIMEILLSPHHRSQQHQENWGIVHQAVQVETPPDLLRYIVETNAQDLTRLDSRGNLPLHYAAAANPSYLTCNESSYLSFYPKYVIDELLYKFPEAASMQDAKGRYPLTIAIRSGKQWIGGGIKSLYDAYPDALKQVELAEHPTLKRALSMNEDDDEKETKDDTDVPEANGVIRDNPHDAIMLVQQPDADSTEIVAAMWAHEEDAGVQMLGCLALSNMVLKQQDDPSEVLRIALLAVAAVVNAMKAHPNEMIVQEKACCALKALAIADGQREISMVASGAVSAIVGGMQAHVGDAKVQEHACAAIAAIVRHADRATVVASVSGVTAILNAIAAHNTVESVQLAGLQALVKLTDFAAEANLPELPRTQTEPLLMAAKDQFGSNNPEIQQAVSVLMNRMSS